MWSRLRVAVPVLFSLLLGAFYLYYTWPEPEPSLGVDPALLPAVTLENVYRVQRGMTLAEVTAILHCAPGHYHWNRTSLGVRPYVVIAPDTDVMQAGGDHYYSWTANEGDLEVYIDPKEGVVACVYYQHMRPPPPPPPWHVQLRKRFKLR
jgi:hypothetical protein